MNADQKGINEQSANLTELLEQPKTYMNSLSFILCPDKAKDTHFHQFLSLCVAIN